MMHLRYVEVSFVFQIHTYKELVMIAVVNTEWFTCSNRYSKNFWVDENSIS